ncbi:MAG TPA: LuxR C-terminal-related transcriptional regulator [Candidatus Sulfotelmatobacter sp.]|nr:LuxR C-terminal-related transcriptional regulator [Candidatus Sulfotelmatobacter sp.]
MKDTYAICVRAQRSEIDLELERTAAHMPERTPCRLALRGMQVALSGNVARGISCLERAILCAPTDERRYFVDLAVPLMVTAGDIDGAERLLSNEPTRADSQWPALSASQAVIAALRGDFEKSKALASQSLSEVQGPRHTRILGRVLHRVALAAFYQRAFDDAYQLALQAVTTHEQLGSPRNAAVGYSLLYALAHDWLYDSDLALHYAESMASSANRSGDIALEHCALIYQLGLITENADEQRFASLRAQLLATPLKEQYRERLNYAVSDAIGHIWWRRFDVARKVVLPLADDPRLSEAERSLCSAIIALCYAGSGDTEVAKKIAHIIIGRTARYDSAETVVQRTLRTFARILAACTCILVGEVTRGRRALSSAFDPGSYFVELSARALDEHSAPPRLRGYARAINTVREVLHSRRLPLALTPAEVRILHMLPEGASLARIAVELDRSRSTVARHVASIYGKLRASNRTQAITRARELGLMP